MEGTDTKLGNQVMDPDAMEAQRNAVATSSLASFVGVDGLAMPREVTKPPGDSKDQHTSPG